MQCRVNGVVINDTPKMCVPNPDDSTHSIHDGCEGARA